MIGILFIHDFFLSQIEHEAPNKVFECFDMAYGQIHSQFPLHPEFKVNCMDVVSEMLFTLGTENLLKTKESMFLGKEGKRTETKRKNRKEGRNKGSKEGEK